MTKQIENDHSPGFTKRRIEGVKAGIDHLFSRLPILLHNLWLSGASTAALALAVAGAAFAFNGTIDYSTAQAKHCLNTPIFLPRLINVSDSANFKLEFNSVRSLLGYPLLAAQTCAVATAPLLPAISQELRLTSSWLPFISKSITVSTIDPPTIKLGRPAAMPISTSGALVFHLSSADQIHNYRLFANQRSVVCAPYEMALLCNLDRLNVKQDGEYLFELERRLNDISAGLMYQATLKTVEPVRVSQSSIKNGQLIQNVPTKLMLTANKSLVAAEDVNLYLVADKKEELVATTFTFADNKLTLTFDKPLKRSAQFRLRVVGLTAHDGGYLLKPYLLSFRTSGGPKVAGANIASYGVGTNQTITLLLDAEPKSGQDLKRYFEIEGADFAYSVTGQGKGIVITPSGSWPRCARFTLKLKDGLKNRYGISGGSAWNFASRVMCRTVFGIGSSVEGRGIYANRFGNGSEKVIFVGGTHGDEPSSVYTLNSLVDYLEANYDSLPSNRTVVVVPNINPDGTAAGRRTNANNVDLNRNFPANNWKKDVVMPGGSLNKGGGGSEPLSEPESAAIANYVLSQSPRLVLTYHAVGSMVIANESGNSRSLATTYGQHTGYWALGNSEIGGIFTHDTTGAFEDWLHDKHGLPALLIELGSYGGDAFYSHQSAIWAMIKS